MRLQCSKCLLSFKDKRTLFKHGWKDDDPRLKCDQCGERFKHTDTLKNHIRVTHENLESFLTCNICCKDFRNKQSLRIHKECLHDNVNKIKESYPCDQCGKLKASMKLLKDHVKVHRQYFECQFCEKQFKALRTLRDHELAKHPRLDDVTRKEYSCDQCEKKKASENLLKVHKKLVHSQFFPCNECGQIRKSARSLKVHSSSCHGSLPQKYWKRRCEGYVVVMSFQKFWISPFQCQIPSYYKKYIIEKEYLFSFHKDENCQNGGPVRWGLKAFVRKWRNASMHPCQYNRISPKDTFAKSIERLNKIIAFPTFYQNWYWNIADRENSDRSLRTPHKNPGVVGLKLKLFLTFSNSNSLISGASFITMDIKIDVRSKCALHA